MTFSPEPRSSMNAEDLIRLRHMLDAAQEAVSFAHGRTRDDLSSDRMLLLSLVKEIEIIGEAANRISAATRANLPDIPWPDLIGMRHRLIHAYADVNLDVVWTTVIADLPSLIRVLQPVLSQSRR